MTTTVSKCPTCNSDVIDRSDYVEAIAPNGDELQQTLYKVKKAINSYYLALDRREHGGVAESRAFSEIERVLGMHWQQGKMLAELEKHPGLKQIYDKE